MQAPDFKLRSFLRAPVLTTPSRLPQDLSAQVDAQSVTCVDQELARRADPQAAPRVAATHVEPNVQYSLKSGAAIHCDRPSTKY